MKKWRCTVCGYIHTGDEPPEKCPVCGADKSKFVEISEEEAAAAAANSSKKPAAAQPESKGSKPSKSAGSGNFVTDMMLKHHLHPISVHFPNGVIPLVFIFLVIAELFHSGNFARAAFYNSIAVLVVLPVVLFTGYNEWKNKYGGSLTTRFTVKIASALIVTATCLASVIWYLIDPGILAKGSANRVSFLAVNLVMMLATGVAGFIGGKFVFKE